MEKIRGIFKKIAAFIAAIVKTGANALKAFFEIGDGEGVVAGSKKVGMIAARRVIYIFADYWMAILSAGIIGAMKFGGYNFAQTFLVVWAYDFVVASMMLIASIKSGQDFTLGESFRRAVNVIHGAHKITGYAAIVFLNIKAVIWDGPEQIVMFFRKELRTVSRMIALLFFLTIIQGAFWTWMYSLGYDSVSQLVKIFN